MGVAAALAACIIIGQGRIVAQGISDEQQIRARRESSNAAIERHDPAGIGAVLAPNVIVVTSNSVHREGRDANVESFAEQFRSRPGVIYRRTPDEVRVFAPWLMAAERGRWTGSWTDARRQDPTRGQLLRQVAQGRWPVVRGERNLHAGNLHGWGVLLKGALNGARRARHHAYDARVTRLISPPSVAIVAMLVATLAVVPRGAAPVPAAAQPPARRHRPGRSGRT